MSFDLAHNILKQALSQAIQASAKKLLISFAKHHPRPKRHGNFSTTASSVRLQRGGDSFVSIWTKAQCASSKEEGAVTSSSQSTSRVFSKRRFAHNEPM